MLQALEILTVDEPKWIKAGDRHKQVRDILGYTQDQMANAPWIAWIGHILNRLHLSDRNRPKAYS